MRLHLEGGVTRSRVTGYGAGYVDVNEQRFTDSVSLFPERVESPWAIGGITDLTTVDLDRLMIEKPEIVLIGTGARQIFPDSAIFRPILSAGVGIEFMDTAAACRTFNVLVGEDRLVCAGLFIDPI